MSEELFKVGVVTHYYAKIGVAIIEVTAPINIGDKIRIKGETTNLIQTIQSMESEHKKIEKANPG